MSAPDRPGVLVPPALANTVFVAVVRHLSDHTHTNGGALTPEARTLLRDLHRAASTPIPPTPTSSEGSTIDGLEILGAHEVAEIIGSTRRTATALLGSGRLRARQVGRIWVTTRGDLDRYRFEEQPHGTAENPAEGGQADRPDTAPEAAEAPAGPA